MVKERKGKREKKRKEALGDAEILEPAFLYKRVILKEGTRTCSLRKKKQIAC